jgi:hypothetical protein
MTATASARRAQLADAHAVSNISAAELATNKSASNDLFLDPMMGAPLTIYIEKDVPDKDLLTDLIIVSRTRLSRLQDSLSTRLDKPGRNMAEQYLQDIAVYRTFSVRSNGAASARIFS